jgi:hypothetical protein
VRITGEKENRDVAEKARNIPVFFIPKFRDNTIVL